MSKKYLDTKEGSLEESVLDVWAEAADDMELDERLSPEQKKMKSAYQRAQAKKGSAGRIGGKSRFPARFGQFGFGLKGHETKAQRRSRLVGHDPTPKDMRATKARLQKKHSPEKAKELEKAKAMIRRQDKADAMTSGPMRDKLRKAKILVRQAEQETFNAELLDLQYMAETLKERIQFLEGR